MGIFGGPGLDDTPAGLACSDAEALLAVRTGGVNEAREPLAAAMFAHQQRVDNAEGELAKALEHRSIARLAHITLYEDRLGIGQNMFELVPGTIAEADFVGSVNRSNRFTVTRFATLGLFSLAAPKSRKHDDREVILLVEAPEWAESVSLPPQHRAKAVRFAKQIELQAEKAPALRDARVAELGRLAVAVKESIADLSDVDRARMAFDRAVAHMTDLGGAIDHARDLNEANEPKVAKRIEKRLSAMKRTVVFASEPPPPPKSARAGIEGMPFLEVYPELPVDRLIEEERALRARDEDVGAGSAVPATGGAASSAVSGSSDGNLDLSVQLERIAGLHASGALSDDEFGAAKARLLG